MRIIGLIDYPDTEKTVATWWGWNIYLDKYSKAYKVFEGIRGKAEVYVSVDNGIIYLLEE